VLLPRHLDMLVAQHGERAGDALARPERHDDLVEIAALGGNERRQEALLVFLGAFGDHVGVGEVGAEDDLDRPLGAHHGNLRRGPGIVDVGADMLRRHHVIGAAEGFAGDHGDERHGTLAVGEQKFGAMLDQPAVFRDDIDCSSNETIGKRPGLLLSVSGHSRSLQYCAINERSHLAI
jgi:hypothetical protein